MTRRVLFQTDNLEFNRATLLNVGFKEAVKEYPWDCFIFHDVDHLPEDDRNTYSCSDQPKHMRVGKDLAVFLRLNPGLT